RGVAQVVRGTAAHAGERDDRRERAPQPPDVGVHAPRRVAASPDAAGGGAMKDKLRACPTCASRIGRRTCSQLVRTTFQLVLSFFLLLLASCATTRPTSKTNDEAGVRAAMANFMSALNALD